MILKVFILIAVMSYYHNSQSAINAASMWGGLLLVFGLLFEGFDTFMFVWVGVSFLVALGVFTLLDHLDGSGFYWPALAAGIGVLVVLG